MPYVILDHDTEHLVRRLANATGATLDEALRDALRARLASLTPARPKLSADEFDAEIARIQAEVARLPVLDPRTPEEMLYDEFGLPK